MCSLNSIVWFRNDLRVNDNHSLYKATQQQGDVIAVYCFDPRHYKKDSFGFIKTEKYRAQFLIETVTALRKNLGKINIPLFVYIDHPETVIPELAAHYNITSIFCRKEWTPEELTVQNEVQSATTLTWHESYDQFLFHPEDVPYQDFNEIPQVFTQFRKACEKQSQVQPLLPTITPHQQSKAITQVTKIPTLSGLGLEEFEKDNRSAFPWFGGEDAAQKRLEHYFWDTQKLAYYKKTRNGLVGMDYSSKFSAWLANGSISARQIYWEVRRFEKEIKKNQDTYWLVFELIWRDYFKYVSLKHGDTIFYLGGILDKEYDWYHNQVALSDWIHGKTPYDFVNANMIELRETGWMSNRGRQNVASYWAKELKQDWRMGAAYFESLLLDYDVHSNYGNWMYNAGVGNDPRDRKFNIKRQAEMYDSSGKFVKLWLQETLF